MIVVHKEEAFVFSDSEHRPSGITLRELQCGTEFAPDNFQLYLVETQSDFETPRHRHNFEQVRIMLQGEFGWAPGKVQQVGTIGYFCEGTFYTQKAGNDSVMLLLQVAGASGDSYMSPAQLRQGIKDLKTSGAFVDGMYIMHTADDQEERRDSYEAIWEHINGRSLSYPRARYDGPIMMNTEAFAWIDRPNEPGASDRAMGRFNERGLTISMLRLTKGASATLTAGDQTMVAFVLAGSGDADGCEWRPQSSMQILRGETVTLRAAEDSMFYTFAMPRFD